MLNFLLDNASATLGILILAFPYFRYDFLRVIEAFIATQAAICV